jgi:hypothetical protein
MTPLPIVAHISRLVSLRMELAFGPAGCMPLATSFLVYRALKAVGLSSRIVYGKAACVEIHEPETPVWWGGSAFESVWVETSFEEVIDLASGSPRDASGRVQYHAPFLWSKPIPDFFVYHLEGHVELDLESEQPMVKRMQRLAADLEKDVMELPQEPIFPNHAMVIQGRVLDDAQATFKFYDRVCRLKGLPPLPLGFSRLPLEPVLQPD